MKEPIISDLKDVTKEIIDDIKRWLTRSPEYCPFDFDCWNGCHVLFTNLKKTGICPCSAYGEKATVLAFRVICDVWKGYEKCKQKSSKIHRIPADFASKQRNTGAHIG